MIGIFVVAPVDPLGVDLLDNLSVASFIETKQRILGYTEVSIQTPTDFGRVQIDRAALGACKTPQEAQALIDALGVELPTKSFQINTEVYQDANDVIWHRPR